MKVDCRYRIRCYCCWETRIYRYKLPGIEEEEDEEEEDDEEIRKEL